MEDIKKPSETEEKKQIVKTENKALKEKKSDEIELVEIAVQKEEKKPEEKSVEKVLVVTRGPQTTTKEKAETPKSTVTISWCPPQPEKVFIAGDFNDWDSESHPLKLDENGIWKTNFELAPGTYEYKFVVDGKWVPDPACETQVKNSFGSYNSVLTVK